MLNAHSGLFKEKGERISMFPDIMKTIRMFSG